MSLDHLQLKESGRLIQSAVETGERQRKIELFLQNVGCSQLHTVVAAQSECFGVHPGFFDQRLGDVSDRKVRPGLLEP